MKKVLMISTIIDFLASFEINNIELLQNMGLEVHCACNCENNNDKVRVKELISTGIIRHHIPFTRDPFSKANVQAYILLRRLIKREKFDVVHCHTPVGGVLGRMAAHGNHVPVIMYTAHGFHFYDGASFKNWVLYYPIEKWMSRYTDVLITINREDYKRAKRKFYAGKTVYIPGIGVDTQRFSKHCRGDEIRREFGISMNDTVLLSVGELNENKNHEMVIRALKKLKNRYCYIIVGNGCKHRQLENLIKELGMENKVKLTGFRNDVADFYDVADVFVLPSFREGLSVSLMEAMASGLPVVCSRIRGNVDLIDEGKGGYLFDPSKSSDIAKKIDKLDKQKKTWMSDYNLNKIKKFDVNIVKQYMSEVYGAITTDINRQ